MDGWGKWKKTKKLNIIGIEFYIYLIFQFGQKFHFFTLKMIIG